MRSDQKNRNTLVDLKNIATSPLSAGFLWLKTMATISLLTITLIMAFAVSAREAQAATKPLALIYKGPGSCSSHHEDGCSDVLARIAINAGFDTLFVGPDGIEAKGKWSTAALWLQPGGDAIVQSQKISSQLKNQVRRFVQSGGGYVGYCAGGFLSTSQFGWVDASYPNGRFEGTGFGVLPGYTPYYDRFDWKLSPRQDSFVIPASWQNKTRYVYWALGPYFDQSTLKTPGVEVISRYADGLAMTVRSSFGAGRVYVSGVHPEAAQSWLDSSKLTDPDGLDADLAVEMFLWAKRK